MTFWSLFVKHQKSGRPLTASVLESRVSAIPTHELAEWAERYLYEIGRGLSDYQKDPTTPEYLWQAVEGSRVLVRILEEIKRRRA